jgi:hypothetical protein
MDWARILAYVTGTVDQELLAWNEYLATESRILKDQLKGRLLLSDAERATLEELVIAWVARFSPRWQRSPGRTRSGLVPQTGRREFSGSQATRSGPTVAQTRGGATDHSHGEREPGPGLRPDRRRHGQSRVL